MDVERKIRFILGQQAAQAATGKSLKAFLDSLKQPRNGHDTV